VNRQRSNFSVFRLMQDPEEGGSTKLPNCGQLCISRRDVTSLKTCTFTYTTVGTSNLAGCVTENFGKFFCQYSLVLLGFSLTERVTMPWPWLRTGGTMNVYRINFENSLE
jgi:hypothetical protein